MINVLLLIPTYLCEKKGGAEKVMDDIVRAMSLAENIKFTVWSLNLRSYPPIEVWDKEQIRHDADNIDLEIFPIDPWHVLWPKFHSVMNSGTMSYLDAKLWLLTNMPSKKLDRALRRRSEEFDLIYAPHYFYGTTHRVTELARSKVVLHPYFHDEPAAWTMPIRQLIKRVDAILVNSGVEKAIIETGYGVGEFDMFEIGNVVEPLSYDKSLSNDILRRFGITNGRYLLYVGRVIDEKNLPQLLDWWSEVHSVTLDIDTLVIAGGGDKIATYKEVYGKRCPVTFTGGISEQQLGSLYDGCLAFVSLSHLESFSLVIMEAWLAGKPVIGHANSGAVAWHIERSGGGLLAENCGQFGYALAQLSQNEELRKKLSKNGKRYVEDKYSRSAVNKNVIEAIQKIVSPRS